MAVPKKPKTGMFILVQEHGTIVDELANVTVDEAKKAAETWLDNDDDVVEIYERVGTLKCTRTILWSPSE